MAEANNPPEKKTSPGYTEIIAQKLSCIHLSAEKTTNIHIQGGISAIGEGAKVVISQASMEAPESIWWMVQKPVASFTGRSSELEQLHEKVMHGSSSRQTLIADKLSAVTGLGGIGKSELARMYAHTKGVTHFDGNVAWINAEDVVSLTASFCGLAEYLGVETKDAGGKLKSISSIVTRVYDHFKKRKALFIFDNAELLATTKPFMPVYSPIHEPPYILLTSRNQDWGDNVSRLALDMLSKKEAMELIMKCLSGMQRYAVTEEDAAKLADTLHCFPLAIQQAVAYIRKYNKRRSFTVEDYINAFESKTEELLNFPIKDSDYVKTVYVTWQVTFDRIGEEQSSQLAIDILGMIAYMHADDIPFSTFLKLADNKEDDLWDALELLEQFSLIKKLDSLVTKEGDEEEAKYSIHRLVQTVLRLQLGPNKEDGYLDKALTQMSKFVKGRYGNFEADRKFLYHAMMVFEHGCKKRDLLEKFRFLPVKITDALLYQARYDEAFDYAKTQHDFMAKNLGVFDHCTIAMVFNKARAVHCIGKHQDAVAIYEKAVEDYTQTLGPLHCDTLAARIDLAFLYIDLEQPEKSLEIFEDVYDKKKITEEAGYCKPDTIELYAYRDMFTVLYGIAHSLQLLKRYSDAETYYQLVHDKRKITDGEFHARTLHAGNKLAECVKLQGRYEEALALLRLVNGKQKETIGEDHPHTLVSRNNIVDVLVCQGKKNEAVMMLLDLFEKKVVELGENHKIVKGLRSKIKEICMLDNQPCDASPH